MHKLVRAKLRVDLLHVYSQGQKEMLLFSVHKLSTLTAMDQYKNQLESVLQGHNDPDSSIQKKWQVLRSYIVSVVEKAVGRGKTKQPYSMV